MEGLKLKARIGWVFWISLLSIVIRVGWSFHNHFGNDEGVIYQQALDLYLNGKISPVGAKIVYSDTSLPGSLLSIVMGLPLFFSHGMPWGTGIFLALINFLAVFLLLKLLLRVFREWNEKILTLFVLFAPWTILYTNFWNPSLLPVFSMLFIYGLVWFFKNPMQARGPFAIILSLLLCLQLHLSFILLGALFLVLWALARFPRFSWAGLLSGLAVGGLFFIPYLMSDQASVVADRAGFLSKNTVWSPEHLLGFPMLFLRFLSFATSETTRFASSPGQGFGGSLRLLTENEWLIPFAVIAWTGSLFLILGGIYFYLNYFKQALQRPHARAFTNPQILLSHAAFFAPLLAGMAFSFSVKGPSAHTFWILMPLAFIPVLQGSHQLLQKVAFDLEHTKKMLIVMLYVTCASVYSIGGFLRATGNDSMLKVVRVTRAAFPRHTHEGLGVASHAAVAGIYRVLESQSKKAEH